MKLSLRALSVLALLLLLAAGPRASGQKLALRLTSPSSNDVWCADSQHHITWDGAATTGNVKLEFSVDAGKTWKDIAVAPDSGRYRWQVPAIPANNARLPCQVRISVAAAGAPQTSAPFTIAPSQKTDYEWTQVTAKAPFAPRDGAGALVFAGKMWFLGGWNPGDKKYFPRTCNNEVWSSRDGAAWVLEKPNTFLDAKFNAEADWEGRHTAGYTVHQGKMWIVGGDVNQGHYHFDVWHSTDGKKWVLANKGKPVPWGPRALHYTVTFKDRIWILGGQTVPQFAASPEVFYRDVWNTSDGVTWQKITPKEPYWSTRGMIGGSAVFKDRIWVLGGGTYDTPKKPPRDFFNDVWSSADGLTWQKHVALAPWEPRQYHDVAVYDDRLWVLEGYGGLRPTNRNDVWYSADGVNWYEVPNTPWAPRHAASVYVHDSALWMVAGNNMESDVWKLRRKSGKK